LAPNSNPASVGSRDCDALADWNARNVTLEPDTEVISKVINTCSGEHDRGLAWDDPALGIVWPVDAERAVLSEKDRKHPLLRDLPAIF
jgi:dTDP-4-dehydrorhamnose 3,5-epimerase